MWVKQTHIQTLIRRKVMTRVTVNEKTYGVDTTEINSSCKEFMYVEIEVGKLICNETYDGEINEKDKIFEKDVDILIRYSFKNVKFRASSKKRSKEMSSEIGDSLVELIHQGLNSSLRESFKVEVK